MRTSTMYRLGGLALILGGLVTLVHAFLPDSPFRDMFVGLAPLLALFGVTALYLWQREAGGVLGDIGYIVNLLGLALIFGLIVGTSVLLPASFGNSPPSQQQAPPPQFMAYLMTSSVIFLIGSVLFGLSLARSGRFPPIAGILYIIGFALLGIPAQTPPIVERIGDVLAGVAVLWLGYHLWVATSESVEQPRRTRIEA